jgi:2,3-dihydroxybenzoate-AMP ligase
MTGKQEVPHVTLISRIRLWAERSGNATAVVDRHESLSYQELLNRSERFASGLQGLGLVPGDRVVLQLPNRVVSLALLFGCVLRGCIPVLALPANRETEIEHLCSVSGAKWLFVPDKSAGYDYHGLGAAITQRMPGIELAVIGDSSTFRTVAAIDGDPIDDAAPDPNSPLFLLLSGGTTGLPKLIPRSHSRYIYQFVQASERCEFNTNTRYLAALSMCHNLPLACAGILGVLECGGSVIMTETPSPDEAFPLIARHQATDTALVPALAKLWIEASEWFPSDLSSLRTVCVGGAMYSPDDAEKTARALSCTVQQAYGMTEGLLTLTKPSDSPAIAHSTQGSPLVPADDAPIVGDNGQPVGTDEEGELLWKGPYLMDGYYNNEAATQESFTADGYFITGDLAKRDTEGNIQITGRTKNIINRAGEKFSAEEVEAVIKLMPGVSDACVCALPDDRLGECTCAFVVTRGATLQLKDVRLFFTEKQIAPYKHPDRIEFRKELPLTAIGKVDTKALVATINAT